MSQGGGTQQKKCVCMREYSVMCMSFFLVSQCHSVTERVCREEGVYSWSRDFCLL